MGQRWDGTEMGLGRDGMGQRYLSGMGLKASLADWKSLCSAVYTTVKRHSAGNGHLGHILILFVGT